jgi:hypothetical protein
MLETWLACIALYKVSRIDLIMRQTKEKKREYGQILKATTGENKEMALERAVDRVLQ